MRFKDIVCHDTIKMLLVNSVRKGLTGNIYVFEGLSGVGKFSMAKAFISFLMCENNLFNNDSCDECENCKMNFLENHPDVFFVNDDFRYLKNIPGKFSTPSSVLRELKESFFDKSLFNKKFYIILNANFMTVEMQDILFELSNCEINECVVIIIAESCKILPEKLVFRSCVLRFNKISFKIIKKYLLDKYNNLFDEKEKKFEEEVEIVSKISEGSIGKAINILKNKEIIEIRKFLINNILNLFSSEYENTFDFILYLQKNKNYMDFILNFIKSVFEDIVKIKFERLEIDEKLSEIMNEKLLNVDFFDKLVKVEKIITEECLLRIIHSIIFFKDCLNTNVDYDVFITQFVINLNENNKFEVLCEKNYWG
ncbi:MAG: hypothetical protein LBJ09_03795 [Clostridiales bacterium]|jgi:DNA polymerase-3 subunit delta'|nr:hypothetical protein [Clostridiales bacterium]